MLSRDLAQGLKNGDKFRKSGPGLTVFSVRFCLQDFILLLHFIEDNARLLLYFHIVWKGHISSYSSHHIIESRADFILTRASLHLVNLLENVPRVPYMVGWIRARERERRQVCVCTPVGGWTSSQTPQPRRRSLQSVPWKQRLPWKERAMVTSWRNAYVTPSYHVTLYLPAFWKNMTGLEHRTLGSLSLLHDLPKQSRKQDDKLQALCTSLKGLTSS